MRTPSLLSLSVFSLAACASALPSSAPAPGRALPANDWRRALVGQWTLEFRLDSVVSRDPGGSRLVPGSLRTAEGRLQLTDVVADRVDMLRSQIDISFDSLLGRAMSCFDPRPTQTAVTREGETIQLGFTPGVFDCGFGAAGTLLGDSLVGTWDETSFAGPAAVGHFRMIRVSR